MTPCLVVIVLCVRGFGIHQAWTRRSAVPCSHCCVVSQAADKCIELSPAFAKGYSRKGAIQFFMKEYDKALETYRTGLTHDPDNEELMEGAQRCVEAIGR